MTSHSDASQFGGAGADRAARDAARWLAALSDERCTDAEREAFMQWLRSSTQHVDEFLRLSTIARRASTPSLWPNDSVEELVAAARASGNVASLGSRTETPAAPTRRTRVPWAIAASFALAVGVGAYLAKPQIEALRAPTYLTPLGEQRSITLEDGSIIQLNSRSRVRAHYTRSLRAIELVDGEAIFRVTKDASRPFRVRAGGAEVVAVGTAFNVNASGARTIVTVLEGRVRVHSRGQNEPRPSQAIELAIGEQLIVSPTAPPQKLELSDTEKVTSWTKRRLIFENTTIGAAALEFARYSPRTIRIEDSELAARKINGVFEATDPASLVQFLSTDASIEVRAQGDDWVVKSRN